jgi:hypothetical protein
MQIRDEFGEGVLLLSRERNVMGDLDRRSATLRPREGPQGKKKAIRTS